MVEALHPMDVFLQPGEYYFGDAMTRIRTVLGSCVAITLWHPALLAGGMCHYMLPGRVPGRRRERRHGLDGRYADEAMELLLTYVDDAGAPRREYEVKLFGGGNMFPRTRGLEPIGMKNIEAARRLIRAAGFRSIAEHLGGTGHRNIIFEVWNGDVWVKHGDLSAASNSDSHGRSGMIALP